MILYRYILREFRKPFIYTFMTITMLFVVNLVVRMLPRVLYRGVPIPVILELFAVNIASIIVLALPMALLLAVLMTFGRLSADNEVVAIKAAGKSILDLLPPMVSLAAVIGLLLIFFTNSVLPEANHHASKLFRDIMKKKPAAMIEAGVLMTEFPGYAIMVDSVEHGSGKIFGITIFSEEKGRVPAVTIADSGTIYQVADSSALPKYKNKTEELLNPVKDLPLSLIEITLFDGETHSDAESGDHFVISFAQQTVYVKNVDSEMNHTTSMRRGDREKSAKQLLEDVAGLKVEVDERKGKHNDRLALFTNLVDSASNAKEGTKIEFNTFEEWVKGLEVKRSDRKSYRLISREASTAKMQASRIKRRQLAINKNLVEVHKKYALGVAAIVFVLLGIPLGIIAKNGSVAVGAVYSLVFYILYYVFLIVGENLGDKGLVPPALAMWIGNLLLFIVAAMLISSSMRGTSFIFRWFFSHFLVRPWKLVVSILFNRRRRKRKSLLNTLLSLPARALKKWLNIVPSYILGRFLSYFLLVTLGLIVLTVVINFVSEMKDLQGGKPREILEYYLYFLSSFMTILLPISMLLSSMLAMGSMSKTSELTAVKAAGQSMVRVTFPIVIVGALVAVGSFYTTEKILPNSTDRMETLMDTFSARRNDRKVSNGFKSYKHNFYYFNGEGETYRFKHFQTVPPRGDRVVRYRFNGAGRLAEVLEARDMKYQGREWVMHDGKVRTFHSDGSVVFRTFDEELASELKVSPEKMVAKVPSVDQLSYGQLKQYMENEARQGKDIGKYEAQLYFKIALAMMNFVVVLIGVAVTARSDSRGGAVHFGKGIGIVFIYLITSQLLLIFGQNGYLHPLVAAWSGTVVFFVLGLYLYRRCSR